MYKTFAKNLCNRISPLWDPPPPGSTLHFDERWAPLGHFVGWCARRKWKHIQMHKTFTLGTACVRRPWLALAVDSLPLMWYVASKAGSR